MDPLVNQNLSLQMHNPLGGSMNFDPLVYGLTQQDIKDSNSPTLKTSFTGWNISMTDEIIQWMQDLSKRKYSTIVLPDWMEDKESGLYLNNERMGYWNKPSNDWTAYIDNLGNFRLSHPTLPDNSLEWDSTLGTLTVRWDISGSIITGSEFQTDSGLSRIEISDAEIRGYADNWLWASKHFATITPSAFIGSYRWVSIVAWADGGWDLAVQWDIYSAGVVECTSIDVNNWWIDITKTTFWNWLTVSATQWHAWRFNSTSTDINDRDVSCVTDIAIWVGVGTSARIYLWNPWAYIWNNNWVLTWFNWLGSNFALH